MFNLDKLEDSVVALMEIIPNIPDDLGQECLLRVPYKSHDQLKTVCRSWDVLVSSPRFYEDRKISGTSEQFICLIQAIPQGKLTAKNREGALPHGTRYDWGWHPSRWEAINCVFVYDFTFGAWRRGADMPTLRSFFACSVSPGGLVYVAGGHDSNTNPLRTAEAYDVKHDKWEILPPMSQERGRCQGVCLDGKFTVISGHSRESPGGLDKSAEVFDPDKHIWNKVENMLSMGGCPRSCLATWGHLCCFHNKQVMRYNGNENFWEVMAFVPESVDVVICATVWRDKIFVIGSTNPWGEQVCYMFDNCGKWVPIDRPHDFVEFVQVAITVEM
eukprot:PITA_31635